MVPDDFLSFNKTRTVGLCVDNFCIYTSSGLGRIIQSYWEGGGLEEWSGDKFDRNLSKRAIDQDQEGQIDQFSNNNVHKLLKEDQEGHIHKYTNLRSIFITMYTN